MVHSTSTTQIVHRRSDQKEAKIIPLTFRPQKSMNSRNDDSICHSFLLSNRNLQSMRIPLLVSSNYYHVVSNYSAFDESAARLLRAPFHLIEFRPPVCDRLYRVDTISPISFGVERISKAWSRPWYRTTTSAKLQVPQILSMAHVPLLYRDRHFRRRSCDDCFRLV